VLESLLQEGDALIKAGRAADAYNLLEPKEADYSGELVFDYLLGIARWIAANRIVPLCI